MPNGQIVRAQGHVVHVDDALRTSRLISRAISRRAQSHDVHVDDAVRVARFEPVGLRIAAEANLSGPPEIFAEIFAEESAEREIAPVAEYLGGDLGGDLGE